MKSLNKAIGNHLYSERKRLGLTQKECGKILGVSFQQIQKYEKGTDRLSLAYAITLINHGFDFTMKGLSL